MVKSTSVQCSKCVSYYVLCILEWKIRNSLLVAVFCAMSKREGDEYRKMRRMRWIQENAPKRLASVQIVYLYICEAIRRLRNAAISDVIKSSLTKKNCIPSPYRILFLWEAVQPAIIKIIYRLMILLFAFSSRIITPTVMTSCSYFVYFFIHEFVSVFPWKEQSQ